MADLTSVKSDGSDAKELVETQQRLQLLNMIDPPALKPYSGRPMRSLADWTEFVETTTRDFQVLRQRSDAVFSHDSDSDEDDPLGLKSLGRPPTLKELAEANQKSFASRPDLAELAESERLYFEELLALEENSAKRDAEWDASKRRFETHLAALAAANGRTTQEDLDNVSGESVANPPNICQG